MSTLSIVSTSTLAILFVSTLFIFLSRPSYPPDHERQSPPSTPKSQSDLGILDHQAPVRSAPLPLLEREDAVPPAADDDTPSINADTDDGSVAAGQSLPSTAQSLKSLDSPDHYTIGWIAALPIERAAAAAMFDEEHAQPVGFDRHPTDSNVYGWGRIREHNIVITSLAAGIYGTTSAATTASNLLASLPSIRIGLMVGIGGGIPRLDEDSDIRLGDIVVSQPDGTTGGVCQYDLLKAKPGDARQRKGFLLPPPTVLLKALASVQAYHERKPSRVPEILQEMLEENPIMAKRSQQNPGYGYQGSQNDRLFESSFTHVGGRDCRNCPSAQEITRYAREDTHPEIHYGIIASGNTLVKDSAARDRILADSGEDCICVEMEAAGLMNHFPCLVIRGICDYADSHKNDRWQRYASATAAAYAKELLTYVPPSEVKETERALEILQRVKEIVQKTENGVNNLVVQTVDVNRKADQILDLNLLKLPVAKGAAFYAGANEHDPSCHPDTRVDLLADIYRWIEDPNGKSIFWLHGMAGTGKSTISRTVAKTLADTKVPSASFFFKKGEGDRGKAAMFFTTIVTQLLHQLPALAPHVRNAIESDPAIVDKSKEDQFEKLFLEPLDKCMGDFPGPLAVVVDALDECDREEDATVLVRLLSKAKEATSFRIRFFVTSRPELPIRLGFEDIDGSYQDLALHEIPKPDITKDISTFLRSELGRIRRNFNKTVAGPGLPPDWPPPSNLETLIDMAVPLFIFASTACRFITDSDYGDPGEQLDKILEYRKKGGRSQLHTTYLPILNQLLLKRTNSGSVSRTENEKTEIFGWFREIVGAIVLFADPLPTASLARFLGRSQVNVNSKLRGLHSVLNISNDPVAPVKLLHLSFRDFLVDDENRDANPFWVDKQDTHERLADRCLKLLDDNLKRDVCDLRLPGTLRSQIDKKTIDSALPLDVQYACRYWVHHWKESKRKIRDSDFVNRFLTDHLLHWLEALGIIGRIRESIGMVDELLGLLDPGNSNEVLSLLHDLRRFLLSNCAIVDTSPLQIYHSALLFAPERSVIRKSWLNKLPTYVSLRSPMDLDWNPCLQTLEGHGGWVNSVAFSADGQKLASASCDNTVKLWDAATGACVTTFKGHGDWVRSVAFSADGQKLASASRDKTVKLWDAATGACVTTFRGHGDSVDSVAFSADGQKLASASDDDTVKLWDAATGACVTTFEGHSGWVRSVAFSADGQKLASASCDNTVKLWDAATGACVTTFRGHGDWVRSVAFSADGQKLASASDDRTVKLWDAATGACVTTFRGHGDSVDSVAFSADGQKLASASDDDTVKLWDAATGACVTTFEGHSNWVRSVAFSADGQKLASASDDRTVKLWDAATGACVTTFKGHGDSVDSVAFSADGQKLASASRDKTVKLWDAATGACVTTFEGHGDSVDSVAFSADGQKLASASDDRTVKLWDAATGACVTTFRGHGDSVDSVAFSADGQKLASASRDKTVKLWDAATGACVTTFEGHSNWVRSVAFSADGQKLASASDDRTVKLWDAATGACVTTFRGHGDSVDSVAFSADGQKLASASCDNTVKLWDAATGACVTTLEGHSNWVRSVAFSADGQKLASASRDKTVKLWDAATGACVTTFEGHSDTVSFDATGSYLHTDFGAKLLSKQPAAGAAALQAHLQREDFEGIGISADQAWITWNGQNLLWLPTEYRPQRSAIAGCTVALVSPSRRVLFFQSSGESFAPGWKKP
ncbi:hypothetical protein RB597_004737 [Gaeumannomyces tritici]